MADANANQNNVTDNKQTDATTNQQPAENGGVENSGAEVTIESLMAEVAQLKASDAKNKAALDKALKEKGEITKLYRAKQTAEEQEAEAKKEADEQKEAYIKGLEKFQANALAKDRYLLFGMDAEMAAKAAEAETNKDFDALATIQNQFRLQTLKAEEAKWIKSRPQPQAGTGNETETEDPFLKGFNSVKNKF